MLDHTDQPSLLEGRMPRSPAALPRVQAAHHASAIANVLTFTWRALLKIKHMPEQLFDVVVTPVMFTVIFTYLLGGALAGSPDQYLQFLLPGILAQTVLFTSVYTGFSFNTDVSKGVYDRFRSMPIWQPAPVVGAMLGDIGRYTVSALIVILLGLIMGFRAQGGWWTFAPALVLLNVFAFGLSWAFMLVAVLARTPATVMTLSWLVLTPLTFVSNAYVDPATMPTWLQSLVAVNPVTLLITALRTTLAGNLSPVEIATALLGPALVTMVCAPTTLMLYRRR